MNTPMKTGISIAGAVAAISLVTGIFTLDDRYMKDAAADEYHLKEATDREASDVDTQVKVLLLEIEWLSSLEQRNSSQETRLEIAKLQLEALFKRQGELSKPQGD